MDSDPEAVVSAALRARASGRPSRRAAHRGRPATSGLLLVVLLGLIAGFVAAEVTVFYPLG